MGNNASAITKSNAAAEITGADAVHPGYGFLAESAYLAEICEACNLKFIGPGPQAIRLMGDKSRAKKAMMKAGVPVVPQGGNTGYVGGSVPDASGAAVLLSLDVREGDEVEAGDRIAVLEAMKTELPVVAPCAGVVGQVLVTSNAQVDRSWRCSCR